MNENECIPFKEMKAKFESDDSYRRGYFEGHEDGYTIGRIKDTDKVCINCKHFVENRIPSMLFLTGRCAGEGSERDEVCKTDEACSVFENIFEPDDKSED